jgi:hypothetical protein
MALGRARSSRVSFAPDLMYIECANIVWKYSQRFGYDPQRAQENLDDLAEIETMPTVTPRSNLPQTGSRGESQFQLKRHFASRCLATHRHGHNFGFDRHRARLQLRSQP